jgi:predicted acyl esterase
MKKKPTSKLAFISLRVLAWLIAVAFIAFALASSHSVGDISSCPSGTAQWPSYDPNILLNTDFYWTAPFTQHPVLAFRRCNATELINGCSIWNPSYPYHVVVQDIRGSPDCANTPFIGDLLYKYDQDDGHAFIAGIKGSSSWCNGNIAMEGSSNGGILSYLAAVNADPALRGIQPSYATGDLLSYGLFNGGVQHKEIPYPVDLQWRLWRVADFNHDNTPDYVLYNPGTSATAVWYLNSDLIVGGGVAGPSINPGSAWQLQAAADFDHDGIPDYVLYNTSNRATAVWYLTTDINGNFIINTGVAGPTIAAGWLPFAVADFDHNNTPDYVLYNPTTRQTAVWYLDSSLNLLRGGYGPTITAGWLPFAVADFDHNNTPDYVLYNPTTRQTAVWYLTTDINGNVVISRTAYGPTIAAGWLPDAVADFDHDDNPDYVLYAPSGQATAVWYLGSDLTILRGAYGPASSAYQISWKDYVGLVDAGGSSMWNKYLITPNDATGAKVAGFHVGGWFDVFGQGILDTYSRMQTAVGNGTSTKQKVVIGPWIHGGGASPTPVGQINFPNSTLNDAMYTDYDTKWKQCAFGEGCNAWNALPAVKVYLMSPGPIPSGVWTTYTTWPPPAQEKTFYFTVTNGTGGLSNTVPTGTLALTFTSNPSSPCPTLGGINNLTSCVTGGTCGPYDQRPIETSRSDLVVFTSGQSPLSNGGPIVGRMYADVWIQTPLPDVDVFVRMTDVYPDGTSMLMAQGIQRAAYRNGACRQSLSNAPTKVRVDLGSTALSLGTGHKLRVIVSAQAGQSLGTSLDPLYSVNPQNGNEYIGAPPNSTPTSGSISVLTGPGQASVLVVPQATGLITPPDHRPPKPTPCPN